jgi:hypothetical protein
MKHNDPALIFFGSASGLLLAVSMPATYAVVAPFHSEGDWFGIGLALATLLAFEVGAVGCKLVTLAIPKWSLRMNALTILLLTMTTVANYATLANIRNAGYAPLVAIVYSATIPILLFVFLSASVARIKQLQASTSAASSLAERRDLAILAALETLSERLQEVPQGVKLASSMSDTPSDIGPLLEAPTAPLALPNYPCPHCGTSLAKPGLVGLAKRYGYCASCKPQNAS